jgi:uncharacterized repeat protein (TIGR01451 family)
MLPAAAQIDNNQPSSPVASAVNCIRSGADQGQSSDFSPRFAISCYGSAWDRSSYNFDSTTANGDAPRTGAAVLGFGDAKPDQSGEAGHITMASLGDNGTEAGDTGVAAVYGLAFSSGTNPAIPGSAPADARRNRLFAAAFHKRLTRYGAGGPGAIYVLDRATNSERLYVQIPAVVPGPAMAQPGPGGFPNTPGDGSSATFLSQAYSISYSPEMGGVHSFEHDDIGRNLAGRVGLGDVVMDANEQYLVAVNINNKRLYVINTWATNPQASLFSFAIDPAPAACPGGAGNFRPFGLHYDSGNNLYVGYTCSAETTQNRADLRAGVLRYGPTDSFVWTRVLDMGLTAYDAQRANSPQTLWQPWSNQLYDNGTDRNSWNQPILSDIEIAESGEMVLGFRSRVGDMSTTLSYPADYTIPQGDILRASRSGSGWSAPSAGATELYRDDDFGLLGGGIPAHRETAWGGLAYIPGTHSGAYGGEVVTSGITPYRSHTSGAYWFDLSGGTWQAREELNADVPHAFAKAAGLGDVELLCVWRAIGNRVWRDTNGNGLQDPGEPDITGVRLQVLNSSGTLVATVTTGTVTGAGDLWRVYVAPFQTYTVRIDPAMFGAGQPLYGLSVTAANQGGNDALDSDADGSGAIAVGAGPRSEVNLSYDVGLTDGANIRVDKTGTATALPNGTISYSIVVTNDGPGIARNVSVVDTLPAGASYAGANPAPTSQSGNTVSWSLGDLGVGSSTTLTLNATVAAATRGSVTNSVTVSTSSSGDSPGDNTDTHTTQIIVPNVFVNKTGTATVLPNGDISYTLSYGNNGTAAAASVTLVDTLPAGTSFISATPAPTSQSGNTVSWNVGTVNVGQSGSITLVARAASNASAGAVLTNNVSISTSTPGDDPGDNTSTTSTTVIAPNVRVNKTGPATSLPGGLVDYTITYDNNGNAAAAGVSIVDTLPAGATFVSASPAPTSQSGSTLTWAIGTLNAGQSGSITLRVQFSASLPRGAVLTNGVAISTTTPGDNPGDNTSTTSTTVIAPNVRVSKTGPARVTAGDQFTYTVTYDNNGNAPAAGVTVVDTLPAGVTFVSASPAPTSQSGSTLTWAIGTVNAGASGSISVVVQANATLANGATLTNGVTISTTTPGDTPSDNSSSWDTLVERADVAIVKSSPTTFPAPSGTTIMYYLDYSNNGPAAARNVVITDAVPAQMSGVSWNCSAGCSASGMSSTISVNVGTLAAGASGRIVVTGTATTSMAREDFTNTARITTSTPETNLTNNESSVPGAVWTSDLLIIKDADAQAVAGRTFNATLTIRNQGPAPATNVQVQDTMPAGVTLVSSNPAPTSNTGATYRWNLGTLGDLQERTITLTLRAAADLDGGTSIVNVATTSGTSDRDPSNNTDDSTTLIRRQSDIRIQKDGPARVTAGNQIAYTLTYANDGPSDARAVVVTDVLPAGVTFVSASPAPTSQSGSTLTWTVGRLNVGQGGTINVTVATEPVQFDPTITVVNQATITDGGSDQPGGGGSNDDPTPGNNTDTSTTDIETSDVLVLKDMPDFVVAGLPFDATVRVENRGPADALNVTLRDFLPPGMTLVSATPPVSVPPARWNLGTLPAGQAVTITLRLRVPSNTPRDALFVNRVTVDTSTPDRDETNNIHEDSTIVRPNADLRVVKDGPAGPILSGSTVTYTLTWANAGPSLAEDVEIRDTLPAGFTFQRATPAPTGNSGGVLTWALGDQDVGASGTITVVGQLATSQGSEGKVNTATIASATDDPDPNNNTDTSTTTVQTVDLSVVKTGNPTTARAGEPYTYTLTIRNAGPAAASSVAVSDTLPASLTFLDAAPLPTTRSGQALTWDLGSMAAGSERTVTISVNISSSARGRLVNTASVGSPEEDRDPGNNTSTHDTPLTAEADLSIVKDGPAGPIRSGSTVTYTLRYHNSGPALANNVVVTDTLPEGFTFTSSTPPAISRSGSTLTWAVGNVDSGNSGTITLVGRLFGVGVSTDRVNVARVDSATNDPTPGDNEDDHPMTVLKPDLSVTKSNGVSSAQPGDLLTYRIVVRNSGLVTATGVLVTETPPAGDVLTGNGWQAGANRTYTQTVPQLGAGAAVTLTMRVQLDNPLPAGMERALNIVTVTDDGSTGPDPTPDDSSSRDDDPLIWGAVGDLVWIDRNKNGNPDPGEPGLSGVLLELLDPTTNEVLARVTTDANGAYTFGGLRLTRYAVRIAPASLAGNLAEYTFTTAPAPATALTTAQREDMSLDIGLYSPTSAVDLAYLKAERQADASVLIRWGTLEERDTARFVVKRTATNTLTANAVIVGQRTSLGSAGGDYRVTDASAPAPATGTLYYWLIEVETDGTQNVYGPASTTATTAGTVKLYLPLVRGNGK